MNIVKAKKLDIEVRTPFTYISKVISELKRGKVEEPNDLPVLSIQTDALGSKNNFMGDGNPPFFWTEVVVQFIENTAQNITTCWMKSQSLARRRRRLMGSRIRLERLYFRLYYRFVHDRFSLFPGLAGLANHIQWLRSKGHYCFAGTLIMSKRGWRRGGSPLRG